MNEEVDTFEDPGDFIPGTRKLRLNLSVEKLREIIQNGSTELKRQALEILESKGIKMDYR